jgi:hypothetical protein
MSHGWSRWRRSPDSATSPVKFLAGQFMTATVLRLRATSAYAQCSPIVASGSQKPLPPCDHRRRVTTAELPGTPSTGIVPYGRGPGRRGGPFGR